VISWLDAQPSPSLAPWLSEQFGVTALAVRDLGLSDASDRAIFAAARLAGAIVITKDRDFPELLAHLAPPPQVLWLTCGNTTTARLRRLFEALFPRALQLLRAGEPLVEITDQR
jgi:predicted nuclease of predicted toxin-antitoxin system